MEAVLSGTLNFIFNTLSAIEALCQTDAQAAAQSIENLSGYLRANIDGLSSEMLIPFNDEFRHIRQYVALEQADPARQFHFDYELDVRDFKLPPLTIQPLVENAVKHGLDTNGKPLSISVTTRLTDKENEIIVEDNGPGYDPTNDNEPHIALNNIRERLKAMCGGSLEITPREGGGTKVIIRIPLK